MYFFDILMLAKIKKFVKSHSSKILLIIEIILIALLSFSLGFITAKISEKKPLKIEKINYEQSKNCSISFRYNS